MVTQSLSPTTETTSTHGVYITRQNILTFIALICLIFLCLWNLDGFAVLRHDEGNLLKVAENYAINGIYADFSSEGDRYTGPVISTGPTVVLPIAGVFKVFGVSVLLARLIIVVYGALFLIVIWNCAKTLIDMRFALVTLLLVLTSPGLDISYYARHVLGEVPALFFLMSGLWLWLRQEKPNLLTLVVVGILFGLAGITKNQLAIFMFPAIGLSFIADLFWYKQRKWYTYVVPGTIAVTLFGAWTYYVLYLLGADARDVSADIEALRALGGNSFFITDFAHIAENIYLITGTRVYTGLFVVAVLYGGILSLRRDKEGYRWGLLWIFLIVSGGFYIVSLGWERYAVPAIALTAFFVARLAYDLTNGYRLDISELKKVFFKGEQPTQSTLITIVVIGVLISMIILPGLRTVYNIATINDRTPYAVADYLHENVSPYAIIETWESELAILTDHQYHFPPQVVEAQINGSHSNISAEPYDFRNYVDADYVIIGQFSDWSGVYTPESLQRYNLMVTIGEYQIYRRQE